MKQFYKSITYLIIFSVVFLMGCTKDIDIEDQFDFEFVITAQHEGFVYETNPFDIVIKPQRVVSGTTYEISYVIEKEESHLETKSPTTVIKPSEKHALGEDLEHSFMYLPTAVGDNEIIVTIKDNHGTVKTQSFKYKSKYAPFVFLITPNLNSYTINARGAITSTLIRKEEDSFKFKYVVTNGTGIIYDGDIAITPGEDYVLKNGVKQLHYVPSTLGLHKITASATASDKAMVTRDIEVSVDNVTFTLAATAATTSVNVNQELTISLDLKEQTRTENVKYEISHSYDPKGLSGIMKNSSDIAIQAGVAAPIEPGVYQYKFKPSGTGISTITFKIKDSNGQVKEATVIITVQNVPFSFTAIPSEKTILLNKNTAVNFNLVTNSSDSNGLIYKLVYTPVEGDGTMTTSSGTVVKAGTPVVIEKGTFNFNYLPKTLGSHKLSFVVTDNNGEQRTASIEMNTTHTPVSFNVSSVTQTYVNQSIPLNFTITPQNSADLGYKMNYYVSGGEGNLKKGETVITPGNYFEVSKGAFQYQYTPTVAGNYIFTFELKDSNGQIVTKELTVVVLNNKFSFTPTPSQNVFVNEDNIFNYALVPTGNYANTTYNVSYSIESGQLGSFYQDDTQVQQGIPIVVTPTAFKLVYKPTSVGVHKIHYIITDSNGLKEDVFQEVKVISSNYKFSIQQSKPQIYKNNSDVLILSLSQEQINPRIKYNLSYSITGVGQLLENGVPLNSGSEITPGNKTYTFVSNQSGTSKIEFNVIDSNGVSHNQIINYTVVNTDFTISTTGDGTLNLGKTRAINYFVSQIVTDNTASYQVRYLLEGGGVGAGVILKNGVEIPFGNYSDTALGVTNLTFQGTQVGPVNVKVEVKDSNGIVHSSTIAFSVIEIGYNFSGATQSNQIFITESTNLNFDITESAPSETEYEIKYTFPKGGGIIKNGTKEILANSWESVNIGSFNRTYIGTKDGDNAIEFTVRNKTTGIQKTQLINVKVIPSEYTFSASATSNNELTKIPVNVNFNVNQVGGGADTYKMIFTTSGNGTFVYNNITYTQGQVIPFINGPSSGKYIGTSSGEHRINFSVSNQDGKSKTSSVNITYKDNDFSLSTSGDGSVNVNSDKNFNVFLSQSANDNEITYQVKYTIVSGSIGNGTLSKSGVNVGLGTYESISKGNSQLVFTGTEVGPIGILVEVKDSNGIVHSSTVNFNVKGITYDFSGAAQENNIFVTSSTNLNFDISETAASGTNYEMKYSFTEGNAQIKNGSNLLLANQWGTVNIGSFNRTLVGTTVGTVKVLFTVRNKTSLVEKTQLITIVVTPSDYSFSATSTNNNQITKTPINVNFNVNQVGGGTDTYNMTFTTSGTGTFNYEGTEYTAGQIIPFKKGSSNGQYIGTTSGVHEIVFSVTNQDAKNQSATVKLNYINNDFSLSTSGDGSLNVNSDKSFNVFLSQSTTDNSINYQVKYTIAPGSVGNGILTKGGVAVPYGTFQAITTGTTEFSFNGSAEGLVVVNVEVKDSNGIVHSATLNFNVKGITYDFSGAAQENNIFVTSSTNLNFDISETAASGTNYEMKYSFTEGNAQIKNGSNLLLANQWGAVNIGSFNRTFVGTTVGTVKVLFTVRNKTSLVEKTQLISIVVTPSDYSFSATNTNNNQITKTPINVNFNVNQVGGGTDIYNMTFTTSGTGSFTYEGTEYTAGQVIPFKKGSSNGHYIGTTGGAHEIVFSVTNQDAKIKSASVKLNYVNNDFSLSSSGDGTLNIKESKDFNIFLSQSTPDDAINYQVKYTIAPGSVGNGTISDAGVAVPFGTYKDIVKGTSQLVFNGTSSGKVNITVEVKDSNGIVHTASILFDVKAITYTFSGSSQYNSIYVNGSTPITFDVTETTPSGTDYEIKYTLEQGNAQIKNGAKTMTANIWESVNVGSFNRTFVGPELGTIKVLFTIRNKVSLVEKTELITITVNPSEFTFNATRANNDQVVNTQTNINFNLTQTGGNSDSYNMTFSTSSTGTFTYNGVEYTAGEIIPFVIGASTGSYKGTKAGKHDLVFTVTNQINISKKADVTVSFINNDYTLSSSGDGSMFLNQTKDFSLFISQLIPDPSITYQVKYSFDSGTTGKGILTQNGAPISLGSYEPIGLGSASLIFKGTSAGNINLLVEVRNSNGLSKTATLMFQVKNSEFTFTGGAQSPKINVGESTPLNFDVTEAVVSGTDYEMSYSVSSGSASIKNGATTLNAFQWYTIATGSFIRNLTPLSQGNSTLIFTVRNKITLQTKTVSVTVNAYQKPIAADIITSMSWFNRGGGKTDQYRFFFFANLIKDQTATIVSATLTFPDNGGFTGPYALAVGQLSSISGNDRGFEWYYKADNSNNPRFYFDKKVYVLTIKDSNGYISTIEGIWHNNEY
jgi:glycine cleavage system regulatory protein